MNAADSRCELVQRSGYSYLGYPNITKHARSLINFVKLRMKSLQFNRMGEKHDGMSRHLQFPPKNLWFEDWNHGSLESAAINDTAKTLCLGVKFQTPGSVFDG